MGTLIPLELQRRYLSAMLQGSGREADRVVEQALAQGLPASRIYLDIFQPTAYEIGRLWQINRIGVGQEHLATAIIERQMGELHPYFRPRIRRNQRIVLGCAPEEWHRIGVRMVADFFEAEGWEVIYLGAAVPVPALIDAIRTTHPDLVGLSATMIFNLPHLTSLARALNKADLDGIPLIVGGLPFARQPDLHHALNIRYSAANAAAAIAVANQVSASAIAKQVAASTIGPTSSGANEEALRLLQSQRRRIIDRATEQALNLQADVRDLGAGAPQVIAAGYDFVTRTLEAALTAHQPELLDEQIIWSNERQPHDGVLPAHILRRLEIYDAVIRKLLPPDVSVIIGLYTRRMIALQKTLLGEEQQY